ncbi:MAG: hypothetical protein H7Y38_13380 [Armatimonadetes bacterium]|nr:hypothetical protein [Armatimonadota bacterium]
MALFLYNLILLLFAPVVLTVYAYRLWRGKEIAAHFGERFGAFPATIASDRRSPRFWVHAVSVGEVMAAIPVLRELRSRHPDALIVFSTTTVGGREVAARQVPPADYVVTFPLDFSLSVANAVRVVRPDAIILMEWEIWLNLLHAAKRHRATVAVVNARVSDTGLKRGTGAKWFLSAGLRNVDVFAAQSAEDAHRAVVVDAPAERVHAVGNTKFDETASVLSPEERTRLRRELGIPESVPVWICGSTRDAPDAGDPAEETFVAEAYRHLLVFLPDLHLIVAPRHLERADTVARIFTERGFAVRRRSQNGGGEASVLLLDTFGELARVYAVAGAAFVGGSLVRRGGQSVFQPLAQGVPAVFGAHMNNQRDIAALATGAGVGFTVQNAQELGETVRRLLTLPPDEKAALSDKCLALIEQNRGVTARSLDLLEAAMRSKSE